MDIKFNNSTIEGFFDASKKSYRIPMYQRAYSWKKLHWETFFNDLKEQANSDNPYFFGNILLEEIEEDKKYEIIDGQQRITTLMIFISATLNVLKKEENKKELKKTYLIDGSNQKLTPVDYDSVFYEQYIINNIEQPITTPSQKRMKDAKEFFEKKLKDILSDEERKKILEKLEKSKITHIILKGKKEAALMFELQNNRGADLTDMEKMKSYFMYQIYIHSEDKEIKNILDNISKVFHEIYGILNDIKDIDEDRILLYHNYAYTEKGFGYRNLVEHLFGEYNKNENKVKWIEEYINDLNRTFQNIKKFQDSENKYKKKLVDKELNCPAYVYPFIIKGYKYFGDDEKKLEKLFQTLEILTFRDLLTSRKARIQDNFNDVLKNFKGDVEELKEDIKNISDKKWYWRDEHVKNTLYGWMYRNKVLNYIFKEYEKEDNEYPVDFEDEEIEHISPQTENGEIASGYDEYDDEFKNEYLHCIGNLLLLTKRHNVSIGNKPFEEKLASFKHGKLQQEIENFAKKEGDNDVWKKESIKDRRDKIVKFAIDRWSYDKI